MPALDYSDIADLYDSFVRFEEDIPFFLEECRTAAGAVAELMAGTGRVSIPLIEAGIRLSCIDSSQAMLAVLRRKLEVRGLNAPVIAEDVVCLSFREQFDLAFVAFNSFAEFLTEGQQLAALSAIHRALAPGGRLLCTLHNPPVRRRTLDTGLTTLGRFPVQGGSGEVILEADFSYDDASRLVHGLEVVAVLNAGGERVCERSVPVRFALIERSAFEALVMRTGFSPEQLYGDYHRSEFSEDSSRYMIWSLRKRSA